MLHSLALEKLEGKEQTTLVKEIRRELTSAKLAEVCISVLVALPDLRDRLSIAGLY